MKLLVTGAFLLGAGRTQFYSQQPCNTAVDQNDSTRECRQSGGKYVWYYLRAKQEAAPTTAANYANNIDATARASQVQCEAADAAAANANDIREGYAKSTCFEGYGLRATFGFRPDRQGTTTPGELSLSYTETFQCGGGQTAASDTNTFCKREVASSVRKSCSLQSQQTPNTKQVKVIELCQANTVCEKWSQQNQLFYYNACPNTQCPAYLYRGGAHARDRNDGKYVYRQVGCTAQGTDTHDVFAQRCEVTKTYTEDQAITSNPSLLPNYYKSYSPFQCQHSDCDRKNGWFIQKGNTDTGPTNHIASASVKQYTIQPHWKGGITSYDQSKSKYQGKCGVCLQYQSSTDPQDILNYYPSQYDVYGNIKAGETPQKWGRGSLSCYNCPDYQRRDTNGNCRRHQCNGSNEIVQQNGIQQGQCIACLGNSVPDALKQKCTPCPAGESVQKSIDAQGKEVVKCAQAQCDSRSIKNAGGACTTCGAYQCAIKTSTPQFCAPPTCPGQIVKSNCACESCPNGSTPDATQRTCSQQACQEWTRRQANGACASDVCGARYRLVQNGVGQGTCQICPSYQVAQNDRKACYRKVCLANQALNTNGECYQCTAGQTVSADGYSCTQAQCPEYTRRQISRGNQCFPDACTQYQRNARVNGAFDGAGRQILQGQCVNCQARQRGSAPNPQYNNARITCEGISCPGNNVITQTGQCQPCSQCSQADPTQTYCQAITCSGRNYLARGISNQVGGFNQGCACQQCPAYQIPNQDRSQCYQPTCTQDKYVDASGNCQLCVGYPRNAQAAGGRSCQPKQCSFNQFVNTRGECQSCGNFQCVNTQLTGCYQPQCGDRTIVKSNCQLENCPPYTRSVGSDCRSCGADSCVGRQFLSQDGRCYPCPEYTIPDPNNNGRDQCIAPQCNQNQIVTRQGTCQDCQQGTNPDFSRRICAQVLCGYRQRIITTGGRTSCEDCPARTRAFDNNSRCAADPCTNTRREYLLSDGQCYKCPPYQIVGPQRDQCIDPVCGANQVVQEDGTCQDCPQYFRRIEYGVQQNGIFRRPECVECPCDTRFSRQYCLPTGQCDTCGDFLIPTQDGRNCQRPNCPQKVATDGTCVPCDEYTFWDASSSSCKPKICPPRQRVLRDGTCETCPAYTYLAANKKDCSPCVCNADQICNVDGKCESCPAFEIVVTTGLKAGKECVRANCPNGVLNRDGTCTLCKACEKLNADKTACETPTCNAKSILQNNGECLECQEYYAPSLVGASQCGASCETCYPKQREYILKSGKCETCPDYYKIGEDYKSCSPVTCTNNDYKSVDGNCIPCDPYTRVNQDRTKCIATPCLDNQILKIDGTCKTCEKYFRADAAQRNCIQSPCTDQQYYDVDGKCLDCPACTRSNTDRLKCFADDCTTAQILNNDGTCQTCPAYNKPKTPTGVTGKCGQVCDLAECPTNSIVLEDGSCQECLEWTKPSPDKRVCGTEVCGMRQKLERDGSCSDCGEFSRGNGQQEKAQYTQCLPDQCAPDQILLIDGSCKQCGPYEKADTNQRACVEPACGARQKLLQDATLVDCAEYTRASEDCRTCRPDQCTLRQKLLPSGQCEDCADYERATPDGKGCQTVVCEKNQILKIDATCEACAPFTKAAPGNLKCVDVDCTQTQRLLPSGECEDCEAYSRAIAGGRACAPNLCTSRQKVLQDGTCEPCDDFKRAFAGGRECASQVCTPRQILLIDGRCADCYAYTRASADGTGCVRHGCKDRQKLGKDGTCVDCPDYERAQGNALTCGADTCNVRQRVLQDGTCKYCPLYQSVCANRRCCSKPTCRPQVEYISKDGVCQPCAFTQRTGPDGTTCVTDPTKKSPDPQVIAPTPVSLEAPQEPAYCTTAGCDVWTEEQFLSEDRATGFYLNQKTGNIGFILGNAMKLSATAASLFTAVLIALNAI